MPILESPAFRRQQKITVNKNIRNLRQLPLPYFAALAVFISAFASAPVPAQQATVLEEVIVTAQKREETLQEAPISVTAFTSSDMEATGAIEFGVIASKAPNVSIRKQAFSHANYAFNIRGVAEGDPALTVEPAIAVYLDGVYLGRVSGMAFDVADTERIEVLRGPQGTLYGRNATGGAVNIIGNKPAEEFSFGERLTVGERGLLRNQFTVNTGFFPAAGGELSARLSASVWEFDGTMKNTYNGKTLGDIDSKASRLALRWMRDAVVVDYLWARSDKTGTPHVQQLSGVDITAGLSEAAREQLALLFEGRSVENYPILNQAAEEAARDRIGAVRRPFAGPETSDIDAHTLTVEWEMPSGVVYKSITSYREWESSIDNFGTDQGTFRYKGPTAVDDLGKCIDGCVYKAIDYDPVTGVPEAVEGEEISVFIAERHSEQNQFTQEFQFSGNALEGKLDWVTGVYYFSENTDEENPQKNLYTVEAVLAQRQVTTALDGQSGVRLTPEEKNIAQIDADFHQTFHDLGLGSICGDPNGEELGVGEDLLGPSDVPVACGDNSIVVGGSKVHNYGADTSAWAIYWHGKYFLDDVTNITVGLRYTEDDKEAYLERIPLTGELIEANRERKTASEDWSKFTWDVSVDRQIMDGINLYGRVATSYRAGSFNARITLDRFTEPVNEENILSYELGAKTQWFGNRVRANFSVFYSDYEDRITSTFSPTLAGAFIILENLGEEKAEGVELELLALPVAGLTVGLNYGYTNVDIKKPENLGDIDPTRADQAPTEPFTPDNTAYAWVEYEFAPSSYGTLSLRLDYDYSDKFTISPVFALEAPVNRATERELWGARIRLSDIPIGGVERGQLNVAFWGRNLKNEEYREFVIPFQSSDVAVYGELRSFGFDISYDYY